MRAVVWTMTMLGVLAGCSSSGSVCGDAIVALCARACECGAGESRCALEAGPGVTVSTDTEAECLRSLELVFCEDPDAASVNWPRCETDAAAVVECAVDPDDGSRSFPLPSSCEPPSD